MLEKSENAKRLDSFVFQTYDAERGAGAEAAAKYNVHSYPTLIVLDEKGTVMVRKEGLEEAKATEWLAKQSEALQSEAQLQARVLASDDLDALWLLARRAEARGDGAAARGWLAKIEAVDRSADREDAASAGWMRIESELSEKQRAAVLASTSDYLRRYPGHGVAAAKALAAAGAGKAAVEEAFNKIVDATSDPGDLNNLANNALEAGALDAALRAGEKLATLSQDPGFLDSIAEVHNYRGEKERAIEVEQKALAAPKLDPQLATILHQNLDRFRKGLPSPDLRPVGELASPLAPAAAPAVTTPDAAARILYSKSAGKIATACATQRKQLGEAYVRVRLGASTVEKVEVLEPAASPALRRCLDRAIRQVSLPADTRPATVTLPIKLG